MDGTSLQTRYAPGTKATRALTISADKAGVNLEARTVTLAFSSEEPYQRVWGVEVLDHQPSSVDLTRLRSGGPVLLDHDTSDLVGVVESVRIDADLVGRAVVRFGRGADADEAFQDVVDGIRRNVSVGYVIQDAVQEGVQDGVPVFRVVRWVPYEISLVSVPADPTVGIGRSATQDAPAPPAAVQEVQQPQAATSAPAQAATRGVSKMSEIVIDPVAEQARGAHTERDRVQAIIAIGEQFKSYGVDRLASEAVRSGQPLDAFRQAAMAKLAESPKPNSDIGMSRQETKRYSFVRVLHALANPRDLKAQEDAAFEMEASRAAADKAGRAARGIMVPSDVLKRDLLVGTSTAGGHTVATDLMSQDFITLLRNRMVIMGMGTRMMTGLQGSIAIPRHTSAATAYWVAESGAPTESQQAFDQVTMQPRTVGAFTDISRKLLLQSSIDVESFVREDLAMVLGQEIQRVAINGSGTAPEPRGILNQVGIGSVVGGTNGLAPAWSHIVALETEVAQDNADVGTLGYLTNAKVRGKMKGVEKAANTGLYLWSESGSTPVNGYRAEVTNAVPSNLTKGSASGICSAIVFGNFADLVIGMWGGLDLMVDPYTGSTSGTVRVVALQDVDVAVRHPESFAAMVDALTT